MAARLSNRKVQVVVICLLAAVVVYNAIHFLGKKPGKRNFVYEEAGLEDGNGPGAIPAWATGEYTPPASWGVNPFTGKRVVPPAAGAVTSNARVTAPPRPTGAAVNITGVMVSGDNKYVLVGDLLLREGDRLGAGTIKTINRDSVIVEYETGTKTLYIE